MHLSSEPGIKKKKIYSSLTLVYIKELSTISFALIRFNLFLGTGDKTKHFDWLRKLYTHTDTLLCEAPHHPYVENVSISKTTRLLVAGLCGNARICFFLRVFFLHLQLT